MQQVTTFVILTALFSYFTIILRNLVKVFLHTKQCHYLCFNTSLKVY